MKSLLKGALLCALLLLAAPAYAQIPPGQAIAGVVTSCGSVSPFPAINAGNTTRLYVDTTGTLCSEGGGGGGGGAITAPLGPSAPSASVSVIGAADPTPTTGNITTVDSGTTCASTPSFQTVCTGTATATGMVQATISQAGYIGVSASISGGTVTAVLSLEISQDGTNWYGRGIFLDSNSAPNWHNSLPSPPFAGLTPGGGLAYYRVRASTFTVLTGSPVVAITIRQGQQQAMQYVGNLPMSANGTAGLGSVNTQGSGTSALPVNGDLQQVANTALGAPTAAGSSASGNILAIQGVTNGVPVPIAGSVTATFSQFAPNGNYSTPLVVGGTSANTTLPSGSGATIAVYNTGSYAAFVKLGTTSGVAATASDDQIAPGGFNCFAVGSNTYIAGIETAGATTLNISGGSGGCAGSGGGGGSSSGGSADTTLTATGTLSAADSATTSSTWTNGQTVLTGTPTTGSTEQFAAFSGVQTGLLVCYGTAAATMELDTLMDAASPGHYIAQTISQLIGGGSPSKAANFTMSGTTTGVIGKVNLAGAIGAQIRATAYTSGSPTCTLRLTTNLADSVIANLLPPGKDQQINVTTTTTGTSILNGVTGQTIHVSAYEFKMGSAGPTTFSLAYSASTSCTSPTTVAGPWTMSSEGDGEALGSGIADVLTVPSGDTLCAISTGSSVPVGGHVHTTQY